MLLVYEGNIFDWNFYAEYKLMISYSPSKREFSSWNPIKIDILTNIYVIILLKFSKLGVNKMYKFENLGIW